MDVEEGDVAIEDEDGDEEGALQFGELVERQGAQPDERALQRLADPRLPSREVSRP